MIVKEQKQIKLINTCGAIYDDDFLISAILNYAEKPVVRLKKVFMYGRYPAVSIYKEKIHIHRLIAIMIYGERAYDKNRCIHHINGNRMDARHLNIGLMEVSKHQRMHNVGKKISESQKEAIRHYNRTRPKVNRDVNGKFIKTYSNIHEVKEWLQN